MSRSPARVADRKPHPPNRGSAAAHPRQARELTKADLELPDGRYLMAYGYRAVAGHDA